MKEKQIKFPSTSNPVYVRIGKIVKAITSVLSSTKNAGTNWFNSGQDGHNITIIDGGLIEETPDGHQVLIGDLNKLEKYLKKRNSEKLKIKK